MSASDSFLRDSQQSAGLSLNLSSNNPFRNRATSPASPASPFDNVPAPPRPVSRNPFLDQAPPARSPDVMSHNSDHKSLTAEEIFSSLTLDESRPSDNMATLNPRRPGGENVPPGGSKPPRPDDLSKNRRMPPPGPRNGPSQSPSRRPPPTQQRRPRRNSDSSALDFDAAPLTEEEKRMIAKRRERERRYRESRAVGEGRESRVMSEGRESRVMGEERDSKKEDEEKPERKERERRDGKSRSGKPVKPSRRMDIIDQLDATSIYGTGLFHHDGPFDALNPHRNRNTSRRAPMEAFPKDSLNNSIGGSGPLRKEADHSTFLGQATEEAFRDYAYSNRAAGANKPVVPIFDPVARGDVIHGDESEGLGTSTFLEGTPAARAAIARHQKEQSQEFADGDLRRKKSLAQRIRHINKGPPRDYNGGSRTNPDAAFARQRSPGSAGVQEQNPFFSEFSKGEESLTVRSREDAFDQRSPPLEHRRGSGAALERRSTTDATGSEEPAKPSGILGRMKSLKGGRRPRNTEPTSPPAQPGTAI